MEQHRRVTIVGAHAMFADVLERTLDRRGYRCCVIVATSANSPTALARSILTTRPQMVVLSIDSWSGREEQAAVQRCMVRSSQRVLAVTDTDDSTRRGEAFFRGAHAVVGKSMALNEFVGVVRRVMYGLPVTERLERIRLIDLYRQHALGREAAGDRLRTLTPQECVVLRHLMAGRRVSEIAALRVVSEQTVRTQVKSVLEKLHVSTQGKAVAVAWDNGWGFPAPAG